MTPVLRKATLDDIPALTALIAASARGLCGDDYTREQIEAALGSAWGVDTQLIRDGTYFVAAIATEIVACGGWSDRATLFGSDGQSGRSAERLDPRRDPARIRAFFVHPAWSRRGLGRAILERCEAEARAHGFAAAALMATLPGVRLYRGLGYAGDERIATALPGGLTIDFVPMRKALLESPPPD